MIFRIHTNERMYSVKGKMTARIYNALKVAVHNNKPHSIRALHELPFRMALKSECKSVDKIKHYKVKYLSDNEKDFIMLNSSAYKKATYNMLKSTSKSYCKIAPFTNKCNKSVEQCLPELYTNKGRNQANSIKCLTSRQNEC